MFNPLHQLYPLPTTFVTNIVVLVVVVVIVVYIIVVNTIIVLNTYFFATFPTYEKINKKILDRRSFHSFFFLKKEKLISVVYNWKRLLDA